MATSDQWAGQGSNELTAGYAFDLAKEIHAEFSDRIAGVVLAAKKEGESVLLAAQRQAQASLAAAREEAGETVAAARREASVTVTTARQEATATVEAAKSEAVRIARMGEEEGKRRVAEANEVALGIRTEAERLRREDAIRRPLTQEAVTSAPASRAESVPLWGADAKAPYPSAGAEVLPASRYHQPVPVHAAAARPNGNGTSAKPSRIERLDPRWVDQLWSQS